MFKIHPATSPTLQRTQPFLPVRPLRSPPLLSHRYDYRTGKNGMLPVGDLIELVKKGKIGKKEKDRLIRRVKEGTPDVVREEVQGDD